jgi:hypothetical protein
MAVDPATSPFDVVAHDRLEGALFGFLVIAGVLAASVALTLLARVLAMVGGQQLSTSTRPR